MKNIMLEIWIAVWVSGNLHKSVVNWQLVGHSKHVYRTTECTIWIWAFWGASAAVCVQSLHTSYPPISIKPHSFSLLPSPPYSSSSPPSPSFLPLPLPLPPPAVVTNCGTTTWSCVVHRSRLNASSTQHTRVLTVPSSEHLSSCTRWAILSCCAVL